MAEKAVAGSGVRRDRLDGPAPDSHRWSSSGTWACVLTAVFGLAFWVHAGTGWPTGP